MDQNRPQVNRKVVLRLTDEEAPGVVLVVTATTGHVLPFYSIRVGQPPPVVEGGDNLPLPFFQVRVNGQRTGGAELDMSIDRLFVMLDKARQFIQTDAQQKATEFVDNRVAEDERRASFGKKQTRHTGKTERDRAKKRGGAA